MTISYPDYFLKVLFRWKGSAWKAVWKEMLIWLCLFYTIRITLYFTLTEEGEKEKARKVIQLFDSFTQKVPLEFLLGFYVVQVVTRWWQQVLKVPWPDDAIAWINALFPGEDKTSSLRRHTIARYLILCKTLALRMISTRIRKRFPELKNLVEAKLMLPEELEFYTNCPCDHTRWQLPLHWAVNSVIVPATGTQPGQLPLVVAGQFINLLNSFKADLRALFLYDWICIPLVYTQTVSVVVYGYFFGLCLIGHQYQGAGAAEPDIYVPVLTILQFFFYVGWLKVAQYLMRPFGEDDDDLELNYILDRHFQLAFTLADHVCTNNPTMDTEMPKFENLRSLPYSKYSQKERSRDHAPKLHACVRIADPDQTRMVFKTQQSANAAVVEMEGQQQNQQVAQGDAVAAASSAGQRGTVLRRCKSLGHFVKSTTVAWKRAQSTTKKENIHF